MNRVDVDNMADHLVDPAPVTGEDRDDDVEAEGQVIEIRETIEQTRAEMSETIDAIQERLSPSNLKEQVKEQVREQFEDAKEVVREATIGKVEDMAQRASDTVSNTGMSIWNTIKANPIPAAMVGAGLIWMWRSGSNNARRTAGYGADYRSNWRSDASRPDYASGYSTSGYSGSGRPSESGLMDRAAETTSSLANRAADTIGSAVGQVQEKAGNLAVSTKETLSGVVDQAQHQVQRAEDRLQSALRDNPLAVGAVALSLGTAVGLALPQTRKENEWMGEARDTVMEKAQTVAQDTMQEVQRAAEKVSDEVGGSK